MRLIHFTLTEYFSTHPDIFSSPHSAMVEICLTYLNSLQLKALSANPIVHTDDLLDNLIDELIDDLSDDVVDDHPFSAILFSILGSPYEKGALRQLKVTRPAAASGL